MSSEPRMRGRRFGRPNIRKKFAKGRPDNRLATTFLTEPTPIDFNQVRDTTLNSLEHLGGQRFPLPPFSEHFQRWLKDVKALLSDLEGKLPQPIDQQLQKSTEITLADLERALQDRATAENDFSTRQSDLQRQLTVYEAKRSRLDSEYKTETHETRRKYEQTLEKLRHEIGTLDAERLTILHKKPSLFQRLFRKPETDLEKKASSLRSKKSTLARRRDELTKDLEAQRTEYESKRKQISEQISLLRAKLETSKESNVDDALDIRKTACEELRREVEGAFADILKQQNS